MLCSVLALDAKAASNSLQKQSALFPRLAKNTPAARLNGRRQLLFSIAFGYNILVNSFQMLRSYAVLANGGFDVQPTLVQKIIKKNQDGTSTVIFDHAQQKKLQRILDPNVADQVVNLMKLVTKPGGTASKADIYGYTEAGKTGTTEKIAGGTYSKNIHYSSFIGFTPAKNPRFVLYIGIDEPESKYVPGLGKNQMGGNCAAPAFREIAARTLEYLGVEPDDPFGYPSGDPRHNAEKADLFHKLQALKLLYEKWNHAH